ncbi:hypothetical protein HMPREF3193_02303 [Bifidobacterium breve]|nr:hypothetical protein HMPREF3193_02303 [Bifidobacterium breve]
MLDISNNFYCGYTPIEVKLYGGLCCAYRRYDWENKALGLTVARV